jgi:hypothetical protein
MQEKSFQNEIFFIIERLRKFFGVKNDTQLAYRLGVSQSAIALWRKRDTINYHLIITKCKGIDLNWLMTGHGSMLLDQPANQIVEDLPAGPCLQCAARDKLLNSQAETIAALKKHNELLEALCDEKSEGQKRKNAG